MRLLHPGMVLCTKALLDKPGPERKRDQKCPANNYCRCTGYAKIIAAVKLAAQLKREGASEPSANDWKIGSSVHRLDVEEKVLGTGKYPDDYLSSQHDLWLGGTREICARVKAIDASKALACPGVYAVHHGRRYPRQQSGRPHQARPVYADSGRRSDALPRRRDLPRRGAGSGDARKGQKAREG